MTQKMTQKMIVISIAKQEMTCFDEDYPVSIQPVSTAKKGVGEKKDSLCTPRGWHKIHALLGKDYPINSVLVGRKWTGELYTEELAAQYPKRDWILTRIIQLDGLEPGRNKGGQVDTLERYIYLHGTPDSCVLGIPGSHGCIRMNNSEIIKLVNWAETGTLVYIQ